ncbi:hypothetical protein BYT27DRAFT_7316212, partial [Phlegmacium glaucopus]
LIQDMKFQGIRRHHYSTAIPLLARPEHIHPSSIFIDVTRLHQAPPLKLSGRGERELKTFYAAGGNHRTEAIKFLAKEEQERIQKLKALIDQQQEKAVGKGKKKAEEKLESLHKDLEVSEATLAGLGKWTVILYNEVVLRAEGSQLGLQLSRNEMDVWRVEDDAEKTTMRYLEYRNEREALEKKGHLSNADRAELSKVADRKGVLDKALKRCLQSEDVLKYWRELMSVAARGRFINTKHFASKWTDKTIHQPGGGLFVEIVSEAAAFFRLLFTPCVLWIDEEEGRRAKFKDLKAKKHRSKEDKRWLKEARQKTWESFDNPKGEPDFSDSMVSMEMLVKLDELNEKWDKDEGRLMFSAEAGDTTEYWTGVRDILKKYVSNTEGSEGGQTIVDNISKKLRWYSNEAGVHEPRVAVPILTPRLLDSLAANITAGAPAYEEVALWLVPEVPYFISTTKHNLISRTTWGLVWQYLDCHRHFSRSASAIRREITAAVMQAIKALYMIKGYVNTGPPTTRGLSSPLNSGLYKKYSKSPEVAVEGTIYKAMKLGKSGHSAIINKRSSRGQSMQFPTINVEGLPWPLTVPWVGSFLTSANPARDFPKHATFALIETEVVSLYRKDMIKACPTIGSLRLEISATLDHYQPADSLKFKLPDGIKVPDAEDYENPVDDDVPVETLVQNDQLASSFSDYTEELQDIIKYCGKKKIMLAVPGGSRDNERVRDAFEVFIKTLIDNVPRLLAMEVLGVNDETVVEDPYSSEFNGEPDVWTILPDFTVMREVEDSQDSQYIPPGSPSEPESDAENSDESSSGLEVNPEQPKDTYDDQPRARQSEDIVPDSQEMIMAVDNVPEPQTTMMAVDNTVPQTQAAQQSSSSSSSDSGHNDDDDDDQTSDVNGEDDSDPISESDDGDVHTQLGDPISESEAEVDNGDVHTQLDDTNLDMSLMVPPDDQTMDMSLTVIQKESGAQEDHMNDMDDDMYMDIPASPVVVENLDQVETPPASQATLQHQKRVRSDSLVMTKVSPPQNQQRQVDVDIEEGVSMEVEEVRQISFGVSRYDTPPPTRAGPSKGGKGKKKARKGRF